LRSPLARNSPLGIKGRRASLKLTFLLPLLLLAIALGVAVGYAAQISRSLPGSATINVISVEAFADVGRSGVVDEQDLLSIMASLNTRPESDAALGASPSIV
jgi:hypothetical protein